MDHSKIIDTFETYHQRTPKLLTNTHKSCLPTHAKLAYVVMKLPRYAPKLFQRTLKLLLIAIVKLPHHEQKLLTNVVRLPHRAQKLLTDLVKLPQRTTKLLIAAVKLAYHTPKFLIVIAK